MIWTASANCLQAADCRLGVCKNKCEREDGQLYVAGLHGQSDDDARRQGATMASTRKTIRQVPTKEAPRSVNGRPAVSMPRSCTVYTAGWCEQDPGPGGWAYVQVSNRTAREESGEIPETTTMRMELTAAIKALEATAPGSTVLVYTASQLVEQGITSL
jgi:RNase H